MAEQPLLSIRAATVDDIPLVARLIRELALRTQTGTSVVALERDGNRQINPGPDEELRAGDTILLLGTPDQLEAAKGLFAPTE